VSKPSEPLNPYQYLHRSELARLAWAIVTELRHQRLRTTDERRDLTQRVVWMLNAYQWLTHGMDMVDSRVGRDGRLAATYMEHYFIEERRLRHSVFMQAETLVRGRPDPFDCWAITTRVEGVAIGQHVYNGADGLHLALSVLEELWNKTKLENCNSAGPPTSSPAGR
jgi:hypothetical protein